MTLSVKRKADRAKMVERIHKIIEEARGHATLPAVRDEVTRGRETLLEIECARRLFVYVEIDGDCSLADGTFVLPWNMRPPCAGGVRLNPDVFMPHSVNPYHGQKCTAVLYTFESMCDHLVAVFRAAQDGSAFKEPT